MALKRFQFTKAFVAERCDFCGRCFAECPVLEFPIEKAVAEIHVLVENRDSEVLDHCTGCMACNTICPHNANPHTLIVSRWRERYRTSGIPYPASLVLPYQEPNLYTVAQESLPADEKALVRLWERNWREPPADTMVYAGCNVLLMPFLMDSGLYRDVPIFGSLKLCCGEPFYRMGCWDEAKAAAENVRREFARMKLKRVIVPCLAGYHLFKYVYPAVFDVSLDVEVVAIEDWFLDRINGTNGTNGTHGNGDRLFVKSLDMSVVLHDNCWPKASGDEFFEKVRTLLKAIGVSVVEPAHTRERALCCGMCAGAARFRLRDVYRVARERLRELERAPADAIVNYCGGCHWLFDLVGHAPRAGSPKPLYHLLELVQTAAGETPKRRTAQRTRHIIASMTPRLALRHLRGGRFRIDLEDIRP